MEIIDYIYCAVVGGVFVFGAYKITEGTIQRKKVLDMLDVNKDGIHSEEEIKEFYDKTKLSPYRKESLKKLPIKDLKKYLYYDNDSEWLIKRNEKIRK